MPLLPLFCCALLTACKTTAERPDALYIIREWPSAQGMKTQKDVAKYIVRAKSSYDSCVLNIEALKSLDQK